MPFADIIGQEGQKKKLRTALAKQTIGHAYLFTGDDGIGKRLTAIRLAQALSCESPPDSAQPDSCGECRTCRQIEDQIHPDCLLLAPPEDKANPQIVIDQIREIERHILYRPLLASRKICIIDDADRLTTSAANAFLKTLEDPPEYSVFILITSQPLLLPATVRSRCLSLRFSLATTTQVEGILALKQAAHADQAKFLSHVSGNRIGVALRKDLEAERKIHEQFLQLCSKSPSSSMTEVLTHAETLSKSGRVEETLNWLFHGFRDLLLVRIGAHPELLLHDAHVSMLKKLADSIDLERILEIFDLVYELEQAPTRNLNVQLRLETLLVRFRQEVAGVTMPRQSQYG